MEKKGASEASANGPIDRIVRSLGHRGTIGSNLKNHGLRLLPMDNLIKAKMENKEVRAASANGLIDRVTTHLGLRATIGSNLRPPFSRLATAPRQRLAPAQWQRQALQQNQALV
jgi:hypothetical protein